MTLFLNLINTLVPALAVVAALDAGFRVARGVRASTRYAAWWLAMIVVLALPFAVTPDRPARPVAPAPPAVQASVPPATLPATPARISHSRSAETRLPDEPFPVRLPLDRLAPAAFAVWAALSAGFLLRIGASCFWLMQLRRRSRPLESPAFDRLLQRRAIAGRVRLLESEAARGPMLVGFLRPAILLPPGLADRLSPREFEDVLLHEIAHLVRRDAWTNLLARAIGAILWFHPAVFWILRRQEQDREMACDEWAALATGEDRLYAASLARLAELRFAARTGLMASGALGRGIPISRRIESLLQKRLSSRASRVRLAMVAGAVLAVTAAAALLPPLVGAAVPASRRQFTSRRTYPAAARAFVPRDRFAQPAPEGFLAGLSAAGYGSISVDEIIQLKVNGVWPAYIAGMSKAGLGRLTPQQLIELHRNGVQPDYAREIAAAGFSKLDVRDVIDLSRHGVRPDVIGEIHRLGFGPYAPREAIDLKNHGVRPELMRALKEYGIRQAGMREVVNASRNGLNPKDLEQARSLSSKLSLDQILKLKRAGVI